jgi:hypothetical protein
MIRKTRICLVVLAIHFIIINIIVTPTALSFGDYDNTIRKFTKILPYYKITSRNLNQISTFEDEEGVYGTSRSPMNIALVEKTFTKAAYDHSFYIFYKLHSHTPTGVNITTDTNLLSRRVTDHQTPEGEVSSPMPYLLKHIKRLTPKSNVTLLTDADVDNGSIFTKEGNNIYGVMILGHEEYVTQQEYDNIKKFVSNGGILILLDGNVLYAEVKYNKDTRVVTLVKGHTWAFNGMSAWKSVGERWPNETSQWIGSNYLCCYNDIVRFANNPFRYTHDEEQYITNPKAKIILDYKASLAKYPKAKEIFKKVPVAIYELDYKKGKVIAFGISSSDIIANDDRFDRFLDSLLLNIVSNPKEK